MIPVNTPLLDGNEKKYLMECIDTGWISSEGPFIKKFEELFSQKVQRKYGIAVANGSAALEIAAKAIGIKTGDEVILPSFTIISPAAAITNLGAVPVLVDSDFSTWNMDVEQIETKITSKTKAIVVVHIYGLPVDMDKVLYLAQKYNLKIIEDAAEMHGQNYKGKPCGSFGDVSTFSFYPNKHITTGEGGMIVTNDETIAEKSRNYRNLCFLPHKRFVHDEIGWNYRMTNLQAALGLAQLERLDEFVVKKRKMGAFYQKNFENNPYIELSPIETSYAQSIYWVFGMILKDTYPHDAEFIMKKLAEVGVGTRPFFYPMHLQPVYQKMGWFEGETYPVAERMANRGFYIPSGLGLQESEMEEIVEKVTSILKTFA
ncbi:MAG: DegT/DnrJ/EryC1/StrS family aminotransferase [Raineya sp.]|jgi:perosamine synthetase|nr:DegT/DnrJ/EryC1/StrS family aminotransferase [Raineya sp.]